MRSCSHSSEILMHHLYYYVVAMLKSAQGQQTQFWKWNTQELI